MQANFLIKVKQAVFDAGTVGGDWAWSLSETSSLPGPVTTKEADVWTSPEAFTSREVKPGTTYKISGARIDSEKNQLGAAVSASFTTEDEPAQVTIDVADVMTVELS